MFLSTNACAVGRFGIVYSRGTRGCPRRSGGAGGATTFASAGNNGTPLNTRRIRCAARQPLVYAHFTLGAWCVASLRF